MSSSAPIEFSCEITSFAEPISGRLHDRFGRSVEFRGWIEFVAALETMAGDAGTQPPDTQGGHQQ